MSWETEAVSFDCGHTMTIEVKIRPTDTLDDIEIDLNESRKKKCLLCRRREESDAGSQSGSTERV